MSRIPKKTESGAALYLFLGLAWVIYPLNQALELLGEEKRRRKLLGF